MNGVEGGNEEFQRGKRKLWRVIDLVIILIIVMVL